MPSEHDLQISKLIEATDTLLWDAYRSAINRTPPAGKLIFPQTSKKTVRVSEQEAKQLLIGKLADTPFLFSIETPTLGKYSFKGKGKRNAMTDLTLYTTRGTPHLNMEFKAGNTSTIRIERKHIKKDIMKLVAEDVNGFWFHILEKANGRGVETLWKTIRHELKAVTQDV